MTSSEPYYWFAKVMPYLFAILPVALLADPPAELELSGPLLAVCVEIAAGFGIVVLVSVRFGVVDCDDDGVGFYRNGNNEFVTWDRVEGLMKIPCCTPPLYRLSFNGGIAPLYFVMPGAYATVGFWSWDFSGIQKYGQARIDRAKAVRNRGASPINAPR